jgi:hypothetical protein
MEVRVDVAWGMPVKPDRLGYSLEAYSSSLPTLQTLRLCHRFGHGPLKKLPNEILAVIENFAQNDFVPPYLAWSQPFGCFEKACKRRDHAPQFVWEAAMEMAPFCEVCEESEDFWSPDCKNACNEKFYNAMDDLLDDGAGIDEAHEACRLQRTLWEAKCNAFSKYDEVSRYSHAPSSPVADFLSSCSSSISAWKPISQPRVLHWILQGNKTLRMTRNHCKQRSAISCFRDLQRRLSHILCACRSSMSAVDGLRPSHPRLYNFPPSNTISGESNSSSM